MHHAAKSTSASWSASSTLPAAWARSQPTTAPAACPAAVRRSTGRAWPVAKFTPAGKTSASRSASSSIAPSRSSIRSVDSPARGSTTIRSMAGSRRARRGALPGVPVGREQRAVGQDRAAPPGRAEEGGQEEMDVDGQAVRERDLDRAGADDPRHRLAQRLVGVNHGRSAANQASTPRRAHASSSASIAALAVRGCSPERLPCEVDRGAPVGSDREQEPVAQPRQRVGGVTGARIRFAGAGGRAHQRGRQGRWS